MPSDDLKSFYYGENVFDMSSEPSKPRIVTGILASGTDGNGEIICSQPERIYHSSSVKKWGRVVEIVDFGKVTTKVIEKKNDDDVVITRSAAINIVTNKAKRWLKSRTKVLPDKVSVKGIDNFFLGKSYNMIEIGDDVKCYSKPHKINITASCLSMSIDFFNHQNDQYVIGPYVPSNYYDPKITYR